MTNTFFRSPRNQRIFTLFTLATVVMTTLASFARADDDGLSVRRQAVEKKKAAIKEQIPALEAERNEAAFKKNVGAWGMLAPTTIVTLASGFIAKPSRVSGITMVGGTVAMLGSLVYTMAQTGEEVEKMREIYLKHQQLRKLDESLISPRAAAISNLAKKPLGALLSDDAGLRESSETVFAASKAQ